MKTNVCVYVGPDNQPTAKIEDVERSVPVESTIVNVWRDPETDELHVSVHTPERVLLSIDSDWWESSTETRYEHDTDIILHADSETVLS